MIQLRGVSKFYYSKGMISSGITKVNLDLDIGEFVVITGESGSGKSTLLNVISGLDTYEEGEMFIEGRETSHFSGAEFEEYRKKYIGNIFQNFNLVNSYTVYQNVELILLINGVSEAEIKRRVPDIIDRVGLTEQINQKVSRLSGGQKQRVAIARALAKDTSIIVADEPTGNLDSESAEEVIELLAEIAKDKLVVVVTHNFDQFEKHATRVVRLGDGRIVEDKVIVRRDLEGLDGGPVMGKISNKDKIRLGVRNTFNIVPKFLLLLVVFLFVTFSVSGIYTNYKNTQSAASEFGFNSFFTNYSDDRIVVKNKDSKKISKEQIEEISKLDGVKLVVKDDILLDKNVDIENEYLSFYGVIYPIEALDKGLDEGSYPEKGSEAVITTDPEMGELMGEPEDVLGRKTELYLEDTGSKISDIIVSGIVYTNSEDTDFFETSKIYLTEPKMKQLRAYAYMAASQIKIRAGNRELKSENAYDSYRLIPLKTLKKGTCIVPEEFNDYYSDGKAAGKKISVSIDNMYFSDKTSLTASAAVTEKTYKSLVGLDTFEEHMTDIFVSRDDYEKMFDKGTYQISVFAKNSHEVDNITEQLKGMDLQYLPLKDSLDKSFDAEGLVSVVQIPFMVLLVVVIFFIAYFVVRLILKSRDTYFAIVRMLGMSKKDIKRILDIEMLVVVTIAYLIFLILVVLISQDIISFEYIKYLTDYMSLKGYILLYLVMLVMSYLISSRASRKLFAASAMQAYRGEV